MESRSKSGKFIVHCAQCRVTKEFDDEKSAYHHGSMHSTSYSHAVRIDHPEA